MAKKYYNRQYRPRFGKVIPTGKKVECLKCERKFIQTNCNFRVCAPCENVNASGTAGEPLH